MNIRTKMKILFQGDSITDCERDIDGEGLGYGYAALASSQMSALYPDFGLMFMNRGISGDCVEDLCARWERDCVRLKPDVVSILVGVNNVWQTASGLQSTDNNVFHNNFEYILKGAQEVLQPQFILCEPFLLDVSEEITAWREDLDSKIAIVKELAGSFNAVYVPFDAMFKKAVHINPPHYWSEDGVHPTHAGHLLMAREWVTCVGRNV